MGNIYILTFQNALNYGAVFQCTALYRTVSGIGNCFVLDYRCRKIEDSYKLLSVKYPIKKNIYGLLVLPVITAKRKMFDEYLKKNIRCSETYHSPDELSGENWNADDVFICGSDQIWNTELTDFDKSYFLDFAKGHRKISYAASTGKSIDKSEYDFFRSMLADFNAISVREKTLKSELEAIDIECRQMIDPVYLLPKTEWLKMATPIYMQKGSFVMIFLLQKSPTLLEAAVKYAKAHNKIPVVITNMARNKIQGVRYVTKCSPSQFLSYLDGADSIFTNSFHGISLSIIFNKNFYFEFLGSEHKTNSRIKDIIDLFGLQKQNITLTDYLADIDYSQINPRIESESKKAMDFLNENLK